MTSALLAQSLPLNAGSGLQNEPNRETGRDASSFVPTLGGSTFSGGAIVTNPVTTPTFWIGTTSVLGGGGGGGGGAGGLGLPLPSGGNLIAPPSGIPIGGTAAGSSFTTFSGSVTLPDVSNATLPPQAGGTPSGSHGPSDSSFPADVPASVPDGGATAVLLGAALLSLTAVRHARRK